jgi:hypothetical protein
MTNCRRCGCTIESDDGQCPRCYWMPKPPIDLWAGFLAHEKLCPKCMGEEDVLDILELAEELAKLGSPSYTPYLERLKTRRLIVTTAMELGIDLTAIKHRVKMLMGRGLLDIWVSEYKMRYGSSVGTQAEWERKRRDIKTRLSRKNGQRGGS